MNNNECKRVQKLTKSFNTLINNCVDRIGIPKKPTVKQITKAYADLNEFIKKSKLNEL